MVTLRDIADDLGVSVSAVSYVFNNKWQQNGIAARLAERIKKKLKEVGYRPNALGLQLKTKKTRTVGVILIDLTKVLGLNILAGLEKVLADAGYLVIVCNSKVGLLEREQLETLYARNVEGVIFSPTGRGKVNGLLANLIQKKVPVVLVDNYLPEVKTDFVVSDNFWGAYQATTFLVNKGCRRIAYLGSEENEDTPVLNDRFNGYAAALKKKMISLSPNLISRVITGPEDIYPAMKKIFARAKPDAILTESFIYFGGGFRFLVEKRLRIPDDLVLTGFDPIDLGLTEMQKLHFYHLIRKPIPFVEQKGTEMGRLAAEILLQKIEKNQKTRHIFLKPDLKFFVE